MKKKTSLYALPKEKILDNPVQYVICPSCKEISAVSQATACAKCKTTLVHDNALIKKTVKHNDAMLVLVH